MTEKVCFNCAYAQSNENGINCYRISRERVRGSDTCNHWKKIKGGEWND